MSGRHEFKNGVTHTIHERERMSLETFTLTQMLETVGYTTGIFGKWHLGGEGAAFNTRGRVPYRSSIPPFRIIPSKP